ncbi:stage III sporulation protein AG [Bacillus sp. HMF5848]|uniref:stage III sporulation protein AG n=1 Tax=Bacillus sp. HMF5848 TaxID=2495421 RepID=UPI000F7A7121|nr:stage III sporulation protein AG [Bacillus sp. HMF5848]RSK27800.1 stage III sporulation protein AG [Bacillus sp. HMF5848]
MSQNSTWWQKIQSFIKKDGESPPSQPVTKWRYAIIILVAGVTLMMFGNWFAGTNRNDAVPTFNATAPNEDVATFGQKEESNPQTILEYERMYENQLKEALDEIVGVSDVTIVVNVDATESKVLEKNIVTQNQTTDETDREGGKRRVEDVSRDEQVVVIRNGEQEVPIILKTKKPEIRGVLIVANGADNVQVKKWILEAVTSVLDVPVHRVAVLPKKDKGES